MDTYSVEWGDDVHVSERKSVGGKMAHCPSTPIGLYQFTTKHDQVFVKYSESRSGGCTINRISPKIHFDLYFGERKKMPWKIYFFIDE